MADATPTQIAPKGPAAASDTVEIGVFDLLESLPPEVREFLMSDKLGSKRTEIYRAFNLTEAEIDIALNTELESYLGNYPIADFPDVLWSRLPWKDEEAEKARQLAVALLGNVMLPAEAYFGDIEGLIRSLGGDPASFPADRLKLGRMSYVEGSRQFANDASLGELDNEARHRAAAIVESYLRGVRKDFETLGALTKTKKVGGAGLTEEQAAKIMANVAHSLQTTVYSEEVKKAAPPAPALSGGFTPEKIKEIYAGTGAEQEILRQRLHDLFGEGATPTVAAARDKFHETLFPNDKPEPEMWSIVAGLVKLAQVGEQGRTTLAADKRFQKIVRDHLEAHDRKTDIELMEREPDHPRVMNIFLQILLRKFANLDEYESARFGLQVINSMRKRGITKYGDLVVFDLELGKFRWVTSEPM